MKSLAGLLLLTSVFAAEQSRPVPDWSRFRGPNGSGISAATAVPTEFGPAANVLWRLPLPPGHSSPVLWRDRIYLTGFRGTALFTFAIDRLKGTILWERQAPEVKPVVVDKRNNPASPSPAVDDTGVYVFFQDYGLIAYELDGRERWKMPLGPFNNVYGMGASPIVVGNLVVLSCDQSLGSFLLAVDGRSGKERWRTARPEAKSGHSTPILWQGRPRSDPPAGLVSADGIRPAIRREAMVGARPVVRDEVHARHRGRYALHQRLRLDRERPR
jgi:outer membrane protein assembly factor BamB